MKKIAMLLVFIGYVFAGVHAQPISTKGPVLTQNSVVKDADGTIYPYAVWGKLLATGNYTVKSLRLGLTDSIPTFLLVKMTEAEKEAFMARLPKPAESTVFKVGEMLKPIKDRDIKGEKFDTKI